jgi:hypothetical protein
LRIEDEKREQDTTEPTNSIMFPDEAATRLELLEPGRGGGGGKTGSKYLTHGADDLEADGAGLELGALGLLIPLRIPPLRVDLLLLPARHPLESTACHN